MVCPGTIFLWGDPSGVSSPGGVGAVAWACAALALPLCGERLTASSPRREAEGRDAPGACLPYWFCVILGLMLTV